MRYAQPGPSRWLCSTPGDPDLGDQFQCVACGTKFRAIEFSGRVIWEIFEEPGACEHPEDKVTPVSARNDGSESVVIGSEVYPVDLVFECSGCFEFVLAVVEPAGT